MSWLKGFFASLILVVSGVVGTVIYYYQTTKPNKVENFLYVNASDHLAQLWISTKCYEHPQTGYYYQEFFDFKTLNTIYELQVYPNKVCDESEVLFKMNVLFGYKVGKTLPKVIDTFLLDFEVLDADMVVYNPEAADALDSANGGRGTCEVVWTGNLGTWLDITNAKNCFGQWFEGKQIYTVFKIFMNKDISFGDLTHPKNDGTTPEKRSKQLEHLVFTPYK
jgi:hypothetical protein